VTRPSDALPVYVFAEVKRPVFHAPGGALRVVRDVTAHTTLCGRVLGTWRAGRLTEHATRLRRDWANKIGTPCAKCFPGDLL